MLPQWALGFDSGPITFPDPTPVGGWSKLYLNEMGQYTFTGGFHDSGAVSFNDSLLWVLRTNSGTAFTFAHTGQVFGTFEPGSRDDNWTTQGVNPAIAASWSELVGASWQWKAHVDWNLKGLFDEIQSAIGIIKQVIAVVGPLLA
jgi:hypothetical protein